MKQHGVTTTTSRAATSAPQTTGSSGATSMSGNPVSRAQAQGGNAAAQEALSTAIPSNTSSGAAGMPSTKGEAVKRHAEGVRRVQGLLAAGLAQEVDPAQGASSRQNLLHNAAEWITEGEAKVRVLAPVHDSAQRVAIPAGMVGYFDATRTMEEGGSTYDEGNLSAQPQVEPEFSGVVGTMDGETLSLYDPATKTEGFLAETIIHEVLHDADQHDNGTWDEGTATGRAPAWAYDSYMTEFRAYWFENAEGTASDAFESSSDTNVGQHTVSAVNAKGVLKVANTSFKNRRQESIWLHLRGDDRPAGDWLDSSGAWVQPYAYVGYYYVLDPAFRKMVDDYDRPRNGNAIASVRIQRLSEAVGITCGDTDLAPILAVAEELDELDRAWLADQESSRPFWEQVRRSLSVPDIRAVREAILGGATSAPEGEGSRYTVVQGDTLGVIADRMLGDPSRWRELYNLNRDVIGTNPDAIQPGQRLLLPDA